MPNVTAPARAMQNGEMVTQFTDTASTTATTFTYPNSQEGLAFINKGVAPITLTASGTSYTVQPGQNQTVSNVLSSFTVQSASGTQQFEASAWSYEKDEVQLTGSIVERVSIQAALAIRDTVEVTAPKLNLLKYRKVIFYLKTTLDQPVKVRPSIADPTGARQTMQTWDGTAWIDVTTTITKPASGRTFILNSIMPELNDSFYELTMNLSCTTIPTTGDVTLWYEGFLR